MRRESKFIHRLAADQMFLNYSFKDLRCARVIPHAIRINHCDGALGTDLQTIRFGSVNSTLFNQSEFFKSTFQKIPRFEIFIEQGTLWFRLVATKKDMPLD